MKEWRYVEEDDDDDDDDEEEDHDDNEDDDDDDEEEEEEDEDEQENDDEDDEKAEGEENGEADIHRVEALTRLLGRLTSLRRLKLRDGRVMKALAVSLRAGHGRKIERLSCSGDAWWAFEAFELLAGVVREGCLPELRTLEVDAAASADALATALEDRKCCPKLSTIDMGDSCGTHAVVHRAKGAPAGEVLYTSLRLSWLAMQPATLGDLLRSAACSQVEVLHFSDLEWVGCSFANELGEALLATKALALQRLFVGDGTGDAVLTALADLGVAPKLTSLHMGTSSVGEEALKSLAEGIRRGALRQLEELWVPRLTRSPPASPAALLDAIVHSQGLPNLTSLDASGFGHLARRHGRLVVKAVAAGAFPRLRSLDLSSMALNDEDMGLLTTSIALGHLKDLQELNLESNNITPVGLKQLMGALAGGESSPRLHVLQLYSNEALEGDNGLPVVAEGLRQGIGRNLTELQLGKQGEKPGFKGMEAICKALGEGSCPRLVRLIVDMDEGVGAAAKWGTVLSHLLAALAKQQPSWTLHLKQLMLWGVRGFKAQHARALVEALSNVAAFPCLYSLSIGCGMTECELLARALHSEALPQVEELMVRGLKGKTFEKALENGACRSLRLSTEESAQLVLRKQQRWGTIA